LDGFAVGTVEKGISEKPRSIAIHSTKRLLFWTDVGSRQAIIKAKIDGSSLVTLAIQLEGVTCLAIDQISNLVFFAHGKKIEYMDINGMNRYLIFQL
jgi:low density lipoprotein receptor-related protein 5/6